MYEIKEAFPPLQEYYGLLSGLGYIVPFVGFGFLVGSLSDQVKSRKLFMGLAVLVWSGCVAVTGFTDSFTVFVLMRVLLGVFESITNPVSYSLLRDIFPPDYRSTANSILTSGVYVGEAVSSLSILVISNYGWRADYFFHAGIGAVLAACSLLVL